MEERRMLVVAEADAAPLPLRRSDVSKQGVARQLDFNIERKELGSDEAGGDPLRWASTVSSMSGSASLTGADSPKRRALPSAAASVEEPRVGAWRHERPPTRRGVKGAPEITDRVKAREINEAEATRRVLIEDDSTTQMDILFLVHCQAQMNIETQLMSEERLQARPSNTAAESSGTDSSVRMGSLPAYIYDAQRTAAQGVVVEDYFRAKHDRLLMLEQLHRLKIERAALLGPATFREIFLLEAIEAQSRSALAAEYVASDREIWTKFSGFLGRHLDARSLLRLVYTGQYRIEQEERAARQFLNEGYRRRFKAMLDLAPAVGGEAVERLHIEMLEQSMREMLRETEQERSELAQQMQQSREAQAADTLVTNQAVVRAYWAAEEVHHRCQLRLSLTRKLVASRARTTTSNPEVALVKAQHILRPVEQLESVVALYLDRHVPIVVHGAAGARTNELHRQDEMALLEAASRERLLFDEAVERCESIAVPEEVAKDQFRGEAFAKARAVLFMQADNTREGLQQEEATLRAHLPAAVIIQAARDLESRCMHEYEELRAAEVDAWAHIPVDLMVVEMLMLEGEEASIRSRLAEQEDEFREEAATEEVGDFAVASAEVFSLQSRTVELAAIILQRFTRRVLRMKKLSRDRKRRQAEADAQLAVEQERTIAAQVLQRTQHRVKDRAAAKSQSPTRAAPRGEDAVEQERRWAEELIGAAVAGFRSARIVAERRQVAASGFAAREAALARVRDVWGLLHVEAELRCDLLLQQAHDRVAIGELRAARPLRSAIVDHNRRISAPKAQFAEPYVPADDPEASVVAALARRQTQLPAGAESTSASPTPGYTTRTNSVDGGIVSVLNSSMVSTSMTPGQVSPAASGSSATTLMVPQNSIASNASSNAPFPPRPATAAYVQVQHHPYSLPSHGAHHRWSQALPPAPNNSFASEPSAWQFRPGHSGGSNSAGHLGEYYRYGREGHVAPNNSVTSEMAGVGQSHLVAWSPSDSCASASSIGVSGGSDALRSVHRDGTAAPNNSAASMHGASRTDLIEREPHAPNNSMTSEYLSSSYTQRDGPHGQSLHAPPPAPHNSVTTDPLQWTDRTLGSTHLGAVSRTTTPNTSFASDFRAGGREGYIPPNSSFASDFRAGGREGYIPPNNSMTEEAARTWGGQGHGLVSWTATDSAEVSCTTVPNNSLADGYHSNHRHGGRAAAEPEQGTVAPNNSISSRPPSPAAGFASAKARDSEGDWGCHAPNNSVTTDYFLRSPPIESAASSTSSLAWVDGAQRAPNSSVTTETGAWALRSPDGLAAAGIQSPVPRAPNNSTTSEWVPTPAATTPRQRIGSIQEPADPLEATATFDPHANSVSTTDLPAAPHSSLASPPVYTYHTHRGVETFTEADMTDSPLRRQGSKTTFLGRRRSSSNPNAANQPPQSILRRPRSLSGDAGAVSVTQPRPPPTDVQSNVVG